MKRKLMFIGDSLTEFYDWNKRFPQDEVFNLGISGETVEELYERLPRVMSKINEADFIFIMTGINNIAMEDFDVLGAYRGIIKTLTSTYKNSTVVVQSTLPVALYWIDNRLIKSINMTLKEISEKYKAEYLDIYSLFIDENDKANRLCLLDDGVHISDKGYEVWSQAVEEYLKNKVTVSSPQARSCV